MHYTLTLNERTVQFLVDQLRQLPHHAVDADLQDIRRQCEAQDRAQAERMREELKAELRAEMEEGGDAPAAVA